MAVSKTERRLVSLEAENAALRAEVNTLKPKPIPALKPKEEEGAGIVPLAPRSRGFIQPTLIELRKMQTDIVRGFPMITLPEPGFREDPQTAVENFAEQVDAAFLAIAHMARAASPDCKRAGWYWIEHCADVLRALGVAPPALTLPAFVIAALMHNDVPFTSLATNPHGLSFGLKFWGDGGAATDAWRKTLAGQLPTPATRKPGVLFFPRATRDGDGILWSGPYGSLQYFVRTGAGSKRSNL